METMGREIDELRAEVERLTAMCAETEAELVEYRRLQKGCPTCIGGTFERAMIDEDGCALGNKPKRWGHGASDYHWFCDDAGAIAENDRIRTQLAKQTTYSIALQRLIEGIKRGRIHGVERSEAPHLYDMAMEILNPNQDGGDRG